MKLNKPKHITILILDDDVFYNNLLAKKIVGLQQKPEINNQFDIHVKQFFKPNQFMHLLEQNKDTSNTTIAFIDYYLGYGINGLQLVYLLEEMNRSIKTVLISQSEKIIKNIEVPSSKSHSFIKIKKHEYTPDICCAIIENHIHNLL